MEAYWRVTPMYLSPESVIDKVQEALSDIWALGCIVLYMLTEKFPWEGTKSEEIIGKIEKRGELPKIPNEISKEAKDFLKGCFVRKPVFRHTCEMLLNHPFVEGLENDSEDAVEEFSEFSCEEYSDEDSLSSWSEEELDEIDDDLGSSLADNKELKVAENEGVVGSTGDAIFDQSNERSKRIPCWDVYGLDLLELKLVEVRFVTLMLVALSI